MAATSRRMPFAIPSSPRITNASASRVFFKCVPPQNSMEYLSTSISPSGIGNDVSYFAFSSKSGDSTSCLMGFPMETTRTGSG